MSARDDVRRRIRYSEFKERLGQSFEGKQRILKAGVVGKNLISIDGQVYKSTISDAAVGSRVEVINIGRASSALYAPRAEGAAVYSGGAASSEGGTPGTGTTYYGGLGIAIDAGNVIYIDLATTSGLSFTGQQLQLDDSIAGDGLDIVGKELSVNVSEIIDEAYGLTTVSGNAGIRRATPSGLAFDGVTGGLMLDNNIAGDGLDISAKVLSVKPGNGIWISTDAVTVKLATYSGLAFNVDALMLADSVAGVGLTMQASKVIDVNAQNGVKTFNDAVTIDEAYNFSWTGTHLFSNTATFTSDPQVQANLDFVGAARNITSDGTYNLIIAPGGDLEMHPGQGDVLPQSTILIDLGDWNRKWRTLFAAELYVETLVAQDVLATIGGRIMVTPTTKLLADIDNVQTTIDVEHNIFASGDFVYMATAPGGIAQIEVMKVTSTHTVISGGYRYTVVRNQDGTGANAWAAGDALAHLGGVTGEGYIELTSTQTSLQHLGPTIAIYNRTGTTNWNDLTPTVALGNLDSFVGLSATMGLAIGNDLTLTPGNGFKGLTADATNGIRLYDVDLQLYNGSTQVVRLDDDNGIVILRDTAEWFDERRSLTFASAINPLSGIQGRIGVYENDNIVYGLWETLRKSGYTNAYNYIEATGSVSQGALHLGGGVSGGSFARLFGRDLQLSGDVSILSYDGGTGTLFVGGVATFSSTVKASVLEHPSTGDVVVNDNLQVNSGFALKANTIQPASGSAVNINAALGVGASDPGTEMEIRANNQTATFRIRPQTGTNTYRTDHGITTGGLAYINSFNDAVSGYAELRLDGSPLVFNESTVGNIKINNGVYWDTGLQDKISLYGNSLGSANGYCLGIESNTLYYKAFANHRWYVNANADGGTSDVMELTSSQLTVNTSASFTGTDVGISNATRPTLTINDTSSTVKGRMAQSSDRVLSYSQNVYYNGSAWYLDDTSRHGWLMQMDATTNNVGRFAIYQFSSGTNPRSANTKFYIDPDGESYIGTDLIINGDVTFNNGFAAGWTTLTPGTGYAHYDAASTVKYRKIGDLVFIRGTTRRDSSGSETLIGTLPTGYRPPYNYPRFPTVTNVGEAQDMIYIDTNGGVRYSGTSGTRLWITLDGIVFSTVA